MKAACGLCERETDGRLCGRCAAATAARLAELPLLYDEVAECLVPRGAPHTLAPTRSVAGPRSPINESVLDEVNTVRAAEVAHLWRADVQRERWPQHSPPPPAGLAADCRWLAMELDWIADHYVAADDLAREVRELEAAARTIVGDPVPRRQRLGLCVAINTEGVVCGAPVFRLPGQTRFRCGWCSYTYTRDDFLILDALQPKEGGSSRAA